MNLKNLKIEKSGRCLNFSKKLTSILVITNIGVFKYHLPNHQCQYFWFSFWFLLTLDQSDVSFLHLVWGIRSLAVLIGSSKGCCWTMPFWFLSSSCFCTPSLNSDAGGSEQLERTLEYGTIHQQPLEGRTSRSRKPPKPGSLCTGSNHSLGVGVVPQPERKRAAWELSMYSASGIHLLPQLSTPNPEPWLVTKDKP